MTKIELVHLHALLVQVAADYRERGLMTDADLDPYREVGVGPASLTESRSEHRRAVRTLLSILADHSDPDAVDDGDSGSNPVPESDADADPDSESESESESTPGTGRPTGNH